MTAIASLLITFGVALIWASYANVSLREMIEGVFS